MKQQNTSLLVAAGLLILAAAFARLISMPPNFAPIGALCIFSGTTVKDRKYAFIFPLAAMLISDAFFQLFTTTQGFYDRSQIFVYGGFMLITYLSTLIRKVNVLNIFLACIWSAAIFFLVSNFGYWLATPAPRTFDGLIQSYVQAIPFYKQDLFGNFALNTVMGNMFFSAVLFGCYAIIKKSVAVGELKKA